MCMPHKHGAEIDRTDSGFAESYGKESMLTLCNIAFIIIIVICGISL